ncbi:hypothetical protein HY640_04595 [Candidatus Woesearchaeota archaeon]|nr:hypothetical protein [Candidatus Woesearchaeota archaeon]
MPKRGVLYLTYHTLIQMLILGIIIILVIQLIVKLEGISLFQREYLSRDIALLMTTIYASPGDIEYTYGLPGKFHITIRDNLVTVAERKGESESSYYFASSQETALKPFESEIPPKAIRITKQTGTIKVQGLYLENQKEALKSLQDFSEFVNTNTEKTYEFRCREENNPALSKGYYITATKQKATLYYESETGQIELSMAAINELSHAESGQKQDFVITPEDWRPAIAITKEYKNPTLTFNPDTAKWQWAQPTIQINELPKCEAEKSARKRK